MDLESPRGMEAGAETVYGTHEDSYVVMSEKVQSLAGSIYQEFERMIGRYDEDVVKTLMPLLVNVLECLDAAYKSNQEHDVELELLREDNEQLVTQYEREKGARKQAEQKLLETEDLAEIENKELSERLESLESICKMLELKHKNSLDHASRLEEREAELKKEYSKLHERYTELFKTHMDYMERTKLLLGAHNSQMSSSEIIHNRNRSQIHPMSRSSGPMSYGFASLEVEEHEDTPPGSPGSGPSSLHSELQTMDTAQETDSVITLHQATSPVSPDTPPAPVPPANVHSRSTTRKEQRSANTLYQELSFTDPEGIDADEGTDITGSWVHPGEYASSVNDNFFGMGKEVENLIMENNELLATKNALNIVKDDLIVKVDELTGEQEILREELQALSNARSKLRARVAELEDEIRKIKEEQGSRTQSGDVEEETDVPMAQRKRFTRVEMARVLMERNQYKERFMELQEAVRWTEMIRASRSDPQQLDKKSKQSIWKFFSNLFSSNDRPPRTSLNPHLRYHVSTHHVSPGALSQSGDSGISGGSPRAITDTPEHTSEHNDRVMARRNTERREQYRQVRAHVRKEDGRLQAYGWSLPGARNPSGTSDKQRSTPGGSVPVPVPVYCRPLAESSPHMKIWCGAGANLNGGITRDGGCMVGNSVFYSREDTNSVHLEEVIDENPEVEQLDKEVKASMESGTLDQQLSSFVWICTSTHAASTVTVINAVNPADILSTFSVCPTHLLCIASVPGAVEKDYKEFDDNLTAESNASQSDKQSLKDNESIDQKVEEEDTVGKITFINLNLPDSLNSSPSNSLQNENKINQNSSLVGSPKETNAEITNIETKNICEVAGECLNETANESNDSETNVHSDDSTDGPPLSSVGPTMWLGAQNGDLFVHSSVATWHKCLHHVRLADAVLSIVHAESRVVAALANGTLVVFRRDSSGMWDLQQYHIVTLGSPQHSVRCLAAVGTSVWCGYRNKVHVLNPIKLSLLHSLEAHPRRESQVRQMAWLGEGVWVSIRLDSTLRLYHAHTYQHLQDVDIEPYVSKMLGTGKLGFSFVRITALLISSSRLWIGTGNGVIISVPLSDNVTPGAVAVRTGTIGAIMPVTNSVVSSFIPYCSMAHAQLSFHGHRDAVKFFVAVPGAQSPVFSSSTQNQAGNKSAPMLVMSGGEGYIDFRIGDGDMEDSVIDNTGNVAEGDVTVAPEGRSHLIVWQVASQ